MRRIISTLSLNTLILKHSFHTHINAVHKSTPIYKTHFQSLLFTLFPKTYCTQTQNTTTENDNYPTWFEIKALGNQIATDIHTNFVSSDEETAKKITELGISYERDAEGKGKLFLKEYNTIIEGKWEGQEWKTTFFKPQTYDSTLVWKEHPLYNGKYVGWMKTPNTPQGYGTFKDSNNTIWEGEWENGKLQDYAVITWSDGQIYEGSMKDNQCDGLGKLYFYFEGEQFVIYEGEFKNGLSHGQGTGYFPDQTKYIGEWKDGKMHGNGTLEDAEGNIREAVWESGVMNKQRRIKYKNGEIYTGELNSEGLPNGMGELKDEEDNLIYEGEFLNGTKNGKGKEILDVGVFEGEFKDGKKHGSGCLIASEGGIWEGTWVDDVMNGNFKIHFDTNEIYDGEVKDGNFHGKGTLIDFDGGLLYEGMWENGFQHGKGKGLIETGSIFEGVWENGKPVNSDSGV